jgi:hypothetical protein
MNPESLARAEVEITRLVKEVYVGERGKAEPIFDGVIEPERYLSSRTRILWVLKEPWDEVDSSGGGWHLCREALAKKPVCELSQATFHPIIYVTYGVLKQVWDFQLIPDVCDMPDAEDILRSIALINAKKLPGVTRGPSSSTILHWYQKGAHIIDLQIQAYESHIILGCGPHFPEVMRRAGIKPTEIQARGSVQYAHANGRLCVQAYHPGQTQMDRPTYVKDILAVISSEMPFGISPLSQAS